MHPTIRILRDEHGALAAVLRSIGLLLSESRSHGIVPDFAALRAMLFYIDEFPEQVHHVKESNLLFPKLRARSDEAREVLERLDHDHSRSQDEVRKLEHDLIGLEMMCEAAGFDTRLAHFEANIGAYITAYLDHIRVEEREVLPLAERVLTVADWAELDSAFMVNRDPLTHCEVDDAYRPLFLKILMTLPAPLGLGAAMQSMRASHPLAQSSSIAVGRAR
ncbi:MAG: hemerythrin domain-containing protein [Caldimonas sp.]